jgi:hypothetical protein
MSLKMANRIATPVRPPKSQNVTTEAGGRTNVLVRKNEFCSGYYLGNPMIESFSA